MSGTRRDFERAHRDVLCGPIADAANCGQSFAKFGRVLRRIETQGTIDNSPRHATNRFSTAADEAHVVATCPHQSLRCGKRDRQRVVAVGISKCGIDRLAIAARDSAGQRRCSLHRHLLTQYRPDRQLETIPGAWNPNARVRAQMFPDHRVALQNRRDIRDGRVKIENLPGPLHDREQCRGLDTAQYQQHAVGACVVP